MSIQPMRTADGRTQYAFATNLIAALAEMPEAGRTDVITDEVSMWVSEHEGYNSLDYDRMCERIEEALSMAVEDYIETQKEIA